MKKRILSLLLALLLIVSMVAGCAKPTDSSSPSPSSSAQSQEPSASNEASELKKEHLIFVFMGETPKNLDAVNEEASKYLTEKINATLEVRPIPWGEYTQRTNLMFTSGEKFDLMFTASWMNEGQQAANGQILAIDDLIAQYAPDYLANVPQDVREAGFINGKAYGLSGYKEWAADKGVVFVKSIADKYGISTDTVKSITDLEPYLEAIKNGEPGMVPLQLRTQRAPMQSMVDNNAFDVLGDSFGVLFKDANDTKVVNMFEHPFYIEQAQLARSWYQKGYFNQDAGSTTEMEELAVKAGRAAGYAMSGKPGVAFQESRNTGVEMVYIPFGKPFMTTGDAASAILAVPNTATDPARSVMFANLLHKDKYLVNLINWGIENQDYVKVSDDVIKYPEGVTAATSTYALNMHWLMGNITLNYTWEGEEANIYDQYIAFNDSAIRSKALGFSFDQTPVKNEIAACKNVKDQYDGIIYSGSTDPATTIAAYNAALKDAGIEKIIAEKQRQLDEFIKNKK